MLTCSLHPQQNVFRRITVTTIRHLQGHTSRPPETSVLESKPILSMVVVQQYNQ